MEESNPKEILICGGCLNDISDEDYVSALSQDWHRDCFRCSVCDAQLTTWFFEKGGMLFCREDYWTRFGDSCQRCGQVVCGAVMAAGELRFHPECFACAACGTPLGDSEPYALVDRDTLYCGPCTPTRVSRVPARAPRVSPSPAPPAAVLVKHPPARALLRAALAACLQRVCARLDAGGTLALRVECVLEEGGGDVQNAPGEGGVAKRAQKSHDNIQPVIEHNPDTINVKRGSSEQTIQEIPKINLDGTSENSTDMDTKREEAGVRRERLFKRKGEDGGKVRVMKKRQTPSSPLLGEKERSSSMSKLLDVAAGSSPGGAGSPGVLDELSRARSFRANTHTHQRVFRDADLLQGELLGTGFFGHVYKVTHRTTGELMVLKQLYRVDDAAQNNFLKEVAVLRSLRHRNVLRFEGVLYRERLHLVTEYVAGGTLHHLLQDKSHPLSWEARVRLARDVAAGVGYLHSRHVIHRDLNSHNCLIRPGEELSVVVADFGLARIVRRGDRTATSRKRYTVVGNPYWMAPEMMNGNLYDEKVDVFSFGIILCEIIGRVSADPDYMPRRSDFGLNERVFREKFCATCPEPFYRLAFLACQLDPDARPPFEVMEVWLESLVAALWSGGAPPPALLGDVLQYAARHGVETSGEGDSSSLAEGGAGEGEETPDAGGVVKSQSTAELEAEMQACGAAGAAAGAGAGAGRALGKCVSAGALCAPPGPAPPRRAASTHALTPGYILRPHEHGINVTKVADISSWVEGALRRTPRAPHLPAFMRNQSEEGLQTCTKHEIHPTLSFGRGGVPAYSDSDSSDDDPVSPRPLPGPFSGLPSGPPTDTAKKSGSLLSARASYDVTEPPPTCYREKNVDDVDCRRFNIDYLKKSPVIANWIENIPKTLAAKPMEKPGFFTKTLGSPKLRRLFRPNTAEPAGRPETDKEERSKSNFFVQRPTTAIRSSYRVRPAVDERNNLSQNVLKCDIKLANMGTPMTPIFRRHLPVDGNFKDGRFSHRERRREPPGDSALIEKNKGRDDKEAPKRRPVGISRSNYVKLENLRISKDGAHLV